MTDDQTTDLETPRHALGWVPDEQDDRDHVVALTVAHLPAKVDLRKQMPPIYDQGQLGSCTANAIAAVFDYERKLAGEEFFTPSRLGIYYDERVIEGTVDDDAGAQIRDGVKSLKTKGVAPEVMWPYDIAKFTVWPGTAYFQAAEKNEALKYARVPQNVSAMKSVLAAGHPIVVGFTVYDSFESSKVAASGIVPMPGKDESVLGGHAVVVVGYEVHNKKPYWIVRNSWGAEWGLAGHFLMPEKYLTDADLSSDFWVVTKLELPTQIPVLTD